MFLPTSRYAARPVAVHVDEQGRARAYVTLREVPQPVRARPEDPRHLVADGDRLDRVAWRHLGLPEQFWRLCDANGAMHPGELLVAVGRQLMVPIDGRDGGDTPGGAAR